MYKPSPSDITGLSPEAYAELERLLSEEGVESVAAQTIDRRDPAGPTPTSFSQELLWMLDRATPGMTAYNLPSALRVRGPLDVRALERALTIVSSRHEALRTRFADGDIYPVQIIDAPAPVVVQRVDLSGLPEAVREQHAKREVTDRVRTPMDLAARPSFRITLIRLAEQDHVLLVETHHIIADGWSMGIVFRELAEAYTAACGGYEPPLNELPIQFGDIAAWERKRLAGARLDDLLTFWRQQLGPAADEPLALPTDFPRTSAPTFVGARETVVLSVDQLAAVKEFAQAHQATLYMTLLAAYATVLHRYAGRTDVLVGSGSAGRSLPEMEGVVGYLNSTVVQRADFSGNPTFAALVERVKKHVVGAFDHQDIPLEKLVHEFRKGQTSQAPLFEVVLTMQDTMGAAPELSGTKTESFGMDFGATKFDITLLVTERSGQLGLTLAYRSELFSADTMRRLLGQLVQVLDSAATNANVRVIDIPLLTNVEREQLSAWNATSISEGTPTTIPALFDLQAARVATRVAVVGPGNSTLTYSDLNTRANKVAHHLRRLGVGANTPVCLLLDRSTTAIVGLLGILKSGGAYVPLSVEAPDVRIAQQLAECGATIVVTSKAGVGTLPSGIHTIVLDDDAHRALLNAESSDNPAIINAPDDIAYVLFTSGSTGTPKGVAVAHANIVHYTRAISRVLAGVDSNIGGDGLVALDGWSFAMASTLAADLGNTSLYPALLSGGTLHVLGQDTTTDSVQFADYLAQHPVDVLKITPNHLMALTTGKTGTALAASLPKQWTVFGGEALQPDIASRLLGAGRCRVLNHYGPTETTVGVCTFEVTRESLSAVTALGAQTVPVGSPLANTRAYIVDEHGSEQPVSIPGELWLGGLGVSHGYFRRDDLTAERFVQLQTPTGADRVYRTGDRVRRLANGSIEFLGRIDHQVKIRGHRVELGEIEQVLRSQPGVETAVAVLREAEGVQGSSLVAYVVLRQTGYEMSHSVRPSSESLGASLAAQLPDYMVPSAVVVLDALPLTANGKIDRAKLPAPNEAGAGRNTFVAPRTETEIKIATMWADVFKQEAVSLSDNFLALGGHSLLAIRVLGKISKTFRVRLPLRALFDAPTVEQLAELVDIEVELAAIDAVSGTQ